MPRQARRAQAAPRLELLEPRTLLSAVSGPAPFTPTLPGASVSVLLRFSSSVSAAAEQADLNAVQATVVESFPDGPTWVSIGPGMTTATAIKQLEADPGIVYADPDATFHTTAAAIAPDDPDFNQQWGLSNPNGTSIDASQAWGVTVGSSSTIIAVLDTGIDLTNADLAGKVWTNPNPYGDAGTYDDVNGWNFVNNNNDVQDSNGHGSHVSGIIAAWSNNGTGVAGINWNAEIMPVKVLDNSGNGSTAAAVSGIYYAVNHGAKVINASWGGGAYSAAMIDAIQYADSHGVVFVTAAGNNSTNNDNTPSYPASYDLPNEISVAAIDESGNLASYSNIGPNTVALAAPGTNILSTVPGGLALYSGTSMATAFVTGVISLLDGLHPTWSAEQMISQVEDTSKPLPGLTGKVLTGGIVDAYNAVANIVTWSPTTGTITSAGGGATVQQSASTNGDTLAAILATDTYWDSVGGTNNGFLDGIFPIILGRAPDTASFNYFNNLLENGASRFTVAQALVNSPEAQATTVARWYQQYFGSTEPLWQLKEDPGVQFWAGIDATYGENTALAGILSTNTYWTAQGSTNTGFLSGIFQIVLGRAPDRGGFAYFDSLLQQGVSPFDVVRDLQNTPEAKAVTVARWYQQYFGYTALLAQLETNSGVLYWSGYLSGV